MLDIYLKEKEEFILFFDYYFLVKCKIHETIWSNLESQISNLVWCNCGEMANKWNQPGGRGYRQFRWRYMEFKRYFVHLVFAKMWRKAPLYHYFNIIYSKLEANNNILSFFCLYLTTNISLCKYYYNNIIFN